MGCGSSAAPTTPLKKSISETKDEVAGSASKKEELLHYNLTINNLSPMVRLDHCPEPKIIDVKGSMYEYKLKFVYVSQRGYYPDDPLKANQDSYSICESLLGDSSSNLYGVFDGHGSCGDGCSYRAAYDIPKNLMQSMNKEGGLSSLDGKNMQKVYASAFIEANAQLHSNSQIDDSLSGTTAVIILQRGDKLFVANVGDSRAIIASNIDGKLQYSPLSSDQTPYRRDERERLKKCGAKIMTIDQIEGNEPIHENFGTELGDELDEGGDPPRVWDKTLEKPGCAFSRSIGDHVGKKVGICPDPEILEWAISPEDKFAVIASDGVFEFITSQNVVEMLAKFKDPIEAAKYVVSEAYRLWLQYDERTDDITIIVLYFDDIRPVPAAAGGGGGGGSSSVSAAAATGSTTSGAGNDPRASSMQKKMQRTASVSGAMTSEALAAKSSKPVRKVMSKARRQDIAENFDAIAEETFDVNAIVDDKSEEQLARISKMLSTNFLFQNLSLLQKDTLYRVMTLRTVAVDEVVIKEGDQGDAMYIVESGEFLVRKLDADGVDQVVFVYTVEGSAFGELSLMYGKPRAASVVAKTAGQLWTIGRAAFRAIVMKGSKHSGEGMLEIYQSIPVFKDMQVPLLHRLCQHSTDITFEKGDSVVTEANKDNLDWCFAVITKGVLRLLPKDGEGGQTKRQLRAELQYFSSHEIGSKFAEAKADSKLTLSCVPRRLYADTLGTAGDEAVKENSLRAKMKGKRIQARRSMFQNPENLILQPLVESGEQQRYQLEIPLILLGDFGYIGSFQDTKNANKLVTLKVLGKARCAQLRMDTRMLEERNFLAAFAADAPTALKGAVEAWVPTVFGSFQNDKLAYLLYNDTFVCDLGLALSSGTIGAQDVVFMMACIYSGLRAIHELGVMHRFLNPNSIYINALGVPKICDFRYAKRMQGAYSLTICGDPLYFAPEIVGHQGYDYSVDLWAYGILLFEMHEESTPFGTSDTAETTVYKNLSAFQSNYKDLADYASALGFTEKSSNPAVQSLVTMLLSPHPDRRAGYLIDGTVMEHEYFAVVDINWAQLSRQRSFQPLDIQPTIDTSASPEIGALFDEAKLPPLTESVVFTQF
mmetsp:Transcript_841/g.1435  ORF Transcript_841/g.1435 Transcript_841/m.1435 type:complete len:1104 (+) Transcript_841:45-3356(+)